MAGNTGGFGDDPLAPGSYSGLLLGNDISGLETDGCFGFTSSFSDTDNLCKKDSDINNPKMLCFGDYAKQWDVNLAKKTDQKPGPACKDSSLPISKKKRNRSGFQNPGSKSGAPTASQKNTKKSKSDRSTVGKKEKLGDRITALQQLVSPFSKTDTASVLHEASGYIRFLHDQVQVLCSPYLQRISTSSNEPSHFDNGDGKECKINKKSDLRSRGLCLVPVELTLHVADSNGADLWSSALEHNTVSTS